MSSKLIFDSEKHVYSINGRYLPGVSSILKNAGLVDFSGIPEDILERARVFGLAVHLATELEDLGTLDIETVDPAIIPYLEAWRNYKKDTGAIIEPVSLKILEIMESPQKLSIEIPVYSEKWWFAGKFDRILTINGKRVMVDIKSSASVYPSMRIQLAGYKTAYEEITGEKINQRLIVQLLKDGAYKLSPCNDEVDVQVFYAAVQIYRFKKKEANYYDRNKDFNSNR